MMLDGDGNRLTEEEVQEMMRKELALTGRIVLCASCAFQVGDIRIFAGLPLRVTRLVPLKEAREYHALIDDARIYKAKSEEFHEDEFHFEVEVAD
jgi:hypothetical protein